MAIFSGDFSSFTRVLDRDKFRSQNFRTTIQNELRNSTQVCLVFFITLGSRGSFIQHDKTKQKQKNMLSKDLAFGLDFAIYFDKSLNVSEPCT